MSQCEVKRIQQNSAHAAYEQAKAEYMSCLPADDRAQAATKNAEPELNKVRTEADQLLFMGNFLLRQLTKETGSEETMTHLTSLAEGEVEKKQTEIEALKAKIRKEKRRFLDSGPQVSPAVAGLYFTKVPDNQVLIAFLSGFGAFWFFAGLLLLFNQIPGIYYFQAMTMKERIKIVSTVWISVFLFTYIGFFVFT
jgi:hypothetical protein